MIPSLVLSAVLASPPVTELRQGPDGWELLHDGKPFYVKGAGAPIEMLDELKAAGANSVRTWGIGDDTGAFLDRAQELGVKVVLGFWIRKDDAFDYSKESDRRAQYEAAAEGVRKYRSHPAILMWAAGNEMELGTPSPRIWMEVEQIVKTIKRNDPTRPVMTVVADMWQDKMDAILKWAPSVDLLGVNSYDGLPTLEGRMRDWKKPYLITEYAFSIPGGQKKTPFGLAEEPSTTEKGDSTRVNYEKHILGHPGRVLGGHFFYFGKSATQTASLHASFLRTGEKLGVVDELTRLWSGKLPANLAPRLLSAKPLDSQKMAWKLDFKDEEGDPLDLTLEIVNEDPAKRFQGDFEFEQPIVLRQGTGPQFVLPPLPSGKYRAYVIARDGQGGAAVWNHPFERI